MTLKRPDFQPYTWRFVASDTIDYRLVLQHSVQPMDRRFPVKLCCDADVAQLVAHHLAKVRVASSSLVIRSTLILEDRAISSAVEHYLDTVGVTGSIPVSRTEPHSSFQNVHADVAQLVAHHLAKVRVASSSLVIRST